MFLKKSLWFSTFLAFMMMAAPVVHAQAQKEAKAGGADGVAFLDTDSVYGRSKAMKNIHEQLAKYQAGMQKSLESEKANLQKEENELNRQRTLLGAEAYAEKRKAFQNRIVDFQRKAQEHNLRLNQVRAKATGQVESAVRDVLKEVVNESQIIVVFNTKQTVYVNAALDITSMVLERLDKRLPAVQVEDPTKPAK